MSCHAMPVGFVIELLIECARMGTQEGCACCVCAHCWHAQEGDVCRSANICRYSLKHRCLWARGEIRWPCSAATWKAPSALMRRNYRARVFTRLRGSEEERERMNKHVSPRMCLLLAFTNRTLSFFSFFLSRDAIACLVALSEANATSKV